MKQVEAILVAIDAMIQAGIVAKLAAIAVEMADGITLPHPRDNAYFINEVLAIRDLPACQVLPNNVNVAVPAKARNEDHSNIIIIFHSFATGGKTDVCAKRTYRYARAIRELVDTNSTLGGVVIAFYATSVDYKPMMADGNTLVQAVWIHCTAKTIEIP